MKPLQITLVGFLLSMSFIFMIQPVETLPNNLYAPKLWLLIALSLGGGLWFIGLQTKTISLVTYARQLRFSLLGTMATLYIVWLAVTSITSPISGYAWFGSPNLQAGSLFLITCYAVAAIYKSAAQVTWVIRAFALSTFTMTMLTLLESIGFRPLELWIHSKSISYPAAFIGHRPHLGGWFAIMSLAPIFFYRARPRDPWFWLWIISSLAGIGFTTTTAATTGVGLGLLAWLAISFKAANWKVPALIFLMFGVFVVGLPSAASTTATLIGLKPPQLKDYGSTASFKPRLYLWKAAWNSALRHPFFGQGDETFAYQVFNDLSSVDAKNLFRAELGFPQDYQISYGGFTYYASNPKTKDHKAGSLIYVRAHSVIFDELYSHGFPGLILLTALTAALLRHVYRRERSAFPLFLVAILPYPVYLLAWFYVPTVTPLFFIMIGTMLADIQRPLPTSQEASHAANTGLYAD